MRTEWDDAKREANIAKHGIDFILARVLFDGRSVVTHRSSYPDEERWLTTGMIEALFITVVWTERGDARRIISARKARNAEKQQYRSTHG